MIREVLIDEKTIKERIKQIANEISNDFDGEKITLICILKGSLYFFADLSRFISLDTELEFIRVSSYDGENSTGNIDFIMDLDEPITGKNVIIVEDIIDTGNTLSYLLEYFKKQNPKSLKLCTLLDKKDRRESNVLVDYVGFSIPNYFVIGYGLDLDQKYRNIPEIECFIEDTDKDKLQKDRERIKLQLKNDNKHK